MTEMITVVVVEDQWMVRDGLTALADIADNINVIGSGSDGNEALTLAATLQPHVMLMDIKMPNLDGIEATRRIKAAQPGIEILVLTTFIDRDLIQRALSAGASGYLTKDISAEDLAEAISAAARGLVQLTPDVAARLTSGSTPGPSTSQDMQSAIDQLTPRERDVLQLLATGASNPAIAKELHLSTGTVKNHVSSILRQLGLTDRTSAAVVASQYRLS